MSSLSASDDKKSIFDLIPISKKNKNKSKIIYIVADRSGSTGGIFGRNITILEKELLIIMIYILENPENEYYLISFDDKYKNHGKINILHDEGIVELPQLTPGGSTLTAVRNNGYALIYARRNLRSDKDVVLEAVSTNGFALEWAITALRADREIVLTAVRQNGEALRYASTDLRANREIVLEAVRQNGRALRYASTDLRADREIVLAAVYYQSRGYGNILQYASAELQADIHVIQASSPIDRSSVMP